MIQLIVGEKGKGKTKYLLDKVNEEVKQAAGSVVYLDKSSKNMFELNNKVRLIDVCEYMVENSDEFIGFIRGIISQDHDLERMYFDSFLKIAHINDNCDILPVIEKLEKIGEVFHVDFVICMSVGDHELAENLKSKVVVSL